MSIGILPERSKRPAAKSPRAFGLAAAIVTLVLIADQANKSIAFEHFARHGELVIAPALHEAGILDIWLLGGAPRMPMLGLFTTLQTIGAQILALVTVALGIWYNERLAGARRS